MYFNGYQNVLALLFGYCWPIASNCLLVDKAMTSLAFYRATTGQQLVKLLFYLLSPLHNDSTVFPGNRARTKRLPLLDTCSPLSCAATTIVVIIFLTRLGFIDSQLTPHPFSTI